MLVDIHHLRPHERMDDLFPLALTAAMGENAGLKRIERGIYEPGFSYNMGHLISGITVKHGDMELGTTHLDPWAVALDGDVEPISSYGTADNLDQVKAHLQVFIDDPDRKYIISIDRIVRAEEPDRGGFRPHKWGPYIGDGDVADHEYFIDSDREVLYHFHIYEVDVPVKHTHADRE